MTDFTWTDEAVDRLRDLLTVQKLSRSQAATVLNAQYSTNLSRNAVIGKANRLNISPLVRVPKPPKPPVRVRGPYKPKPPKPPAPPEGPSIGIMELQNHHCRWMPAPAAYCGDPTADVLEGRSYCAYHHTIVYRPRPYGLNAR